MSKELNYFKVDALSAFNDAFTAEEPTRLIIQTSSGTLNGVLLPTGEFPKVYDDEEKFIGDTSDQKTYYSVVNTLLNSYRKQTNKNVETVDTYPKGLWLKDVSMFLPSQPLPIEMPYYYLFLDQVVGVSLGDLKVSD